MIWAYSAWLREWRMHAIQVSISN
ncbi:hypothetical protein Pint_14125 [Pistacia integerrima]|uniref:Uncharacterized protein n=1 Tax=Pistacia integerrima TaxID=434235 RepID=A0ACC0YB68_9ROSI|nr:hypothetical protein Pint_14125 [Pistacia integerrima]